MLVCLLCSALLILVLIDIQCESSPNRGMNDKKGIREAHLEPEDRCIPRSLFIHIPPYPRTVSSWSCHRNQLHVPMRLYQYNSSYMALQALALPNSLELTPIPRLTSILITQW